MAAALWTDEELEADVTLDAIVTVVDAGHIEKQLNEPRMHGAINEAQDQVAYADVILLNKARSSSQCPVWVQYITYEQETMSAAVSWLGCTDLQESMAYIWRNDIAKHCSVSSASRYGARSSVRPWCDNGFASVIWTNSLLWETQIGLRDWSEEVLQIDMVDGSHVQHITQQLRRINEIAAIHKTSRCRIDLGLILNRFTVLDGLCSAREQASDRAKSRAGFSDRDHLKSTDSFSDGSHNHSHAHKAEHSHTHDQQIGTVRLALPGLLDLERCSDWSTRLQHFKCLPQGVCSTPCLCQTSLFCPACCQAQTTLQLGTCNLTWNTSLNTLKAVCTLSSKIYGSATAVFSLQQIHMQEHASSFDFPSIGCQMIMQVKL